MYKPVRAAETGNSAVWICIFGTLWAYLSSQSQTYVSIRNQIPTRGKTRVPRPGEEISLK